MDDIDYVRQLDPELVEADPESARAAGRYMRKSLRRGRSDIFQINGREYYRNKRGKCEDAPCCGCCTI